MNTILNRVILISLILMHSINLNASITNEPDRSWNFIVFLDETPIGEHKFHVTNKGDVEQINIKASFDVHFLFIPVYSYTHENTEIWNNNCLNKLVSKTTDNGTPHEVEISSNGNSANINTLDTSIEFNSICLRSFAYWNPELLETDKLLNAQTGEVVDIYFRHIGKEKHKVFDKEYISNKYRLTGDNINIELWYTEDNEWLALESTVENGSVLRYQLTEDSLP